MDVLVTTKDLLDRGVWQPQHLVNHLLDEAVALDEGRPRDDISVIAVSVGDSPEDEVRRLHGRLPLKG